MEKMYQVWRVGLRFDGGIQHWSSKPLNQQDAIQLQTKWQQVTHEITDDECDVSFSNAAKHKDMKEVLSTEIVPFKVETNYADGKERKITVNGIVYTYVTAQDGITTIKKNGQEVAKYHGDPHDREPSGVRTIVREEGL